MKDSDVFLYMYLVVEDPDDPLHQEQYLVHNVHPSAMVLILCLQYTHGVLWRLYRQSYQTELPLEGVICEGQDTDQTRLQMYHFLPKLKYKKTEY